MKKLSIIIVSLCLLVTATNSAKVTSNTQSNHVEESSAWVDSVFRSMSPEERIGQLIAQVVDPSKPAAARTEIKRLVNRYHIGFIYFSKGTVENHAQLANYVNSISKTPVMVSLDGEWGLSMRMYDTPMFPKNMALGAISDDRLLYEYGQEMARECRLMGVNVNFAPSVDVNLNPDNPVIGVRSFGEDPNNVAGKAVAYARGLEDGGVLSVAKHFPGHGDTNKDSHKTLPSIDRPYVDMQTTDFVPFRSYIKAGLSGVMVGHLSMPALKTGSLPTSLSQNVVSGLLKTSFGFKGLVFTDALAMMGARVKGKANGLMALQAGADVMLEPYNLEFNFKELKAAYAKGGKEKTMIDVACKKILSYKYKVGLYDYKPVDTNNLKKRINSRSAELVMRKLYAATITVLKNDNDILPVKGLDKEISVVSLGAPAENSFTKTCRLYTKIKAYSLTDDNMESVISAVKKTSQTIIAVYDADLQTSMNVDRFLLSMDEKHKIVPVFFIKPYSLSLFSGDISLCNTAVLAYDGHKYAQEYAAQAIFGGSDVTGRIPVTVDGVANCGDGISIHASRLGYGMPEEVGLDARFEKEADDLAKEGIEEGAYTGCQVLVACHGKVIFNKSYGYTDNKKSSRVNGNTLFDLASVSKATGTLSGVMKAIDMRKLQVDASLGSYVPQLRGSEKGNLTLRNLLFHETGMPAYLNMYKLMTQDGSYTGELISGRKSPEYSRYAGGAYINSEAKVRRDITSAVKTDKFDYRIGKELYVGQPTYDTIMNIIHNEPLRSDRHYLYSCLNFCMLMEAEQKATGIRHDRFVYKNIFRPLGAFRSVYRPLDFFKKSEIAATEEDEYFRRELVDGSVHDETAAFSGGIQGNAGFFSNANDLAKLCEMWLNGGMYGGEQILSTPTVRLFTTTKSPNSHRGLGFDKPNVENPDASSTCEEADPSVYGHTGFTGTCFWVDPKNDMIYIFLSNRVCPTRNNPAFSRVGARAGIFKLLYQSLARTRK